MHFGDKVSDDQIEEWLWRSTFAEEHQSKPESYVSRLVREMRDGDPRLALEVKKPIDSDLLVTRTRRAGTAVAVGFDLLLRRIGARSLLSGEPVSGSDLLHGALFSKSELDYAFSSRAPSPRNLANLVLLTPSDAMEWNRIRGASSLEHLFEESERRTGNAAAIWATQGLGRPDAADPSEVLHERSRWLLPRVVPTGE